ncbi:MAG: outer membrane beta-barrel protein [bacterium]|nr:outer membrane beta-barrel protein [bacterium]
MTALTLALRGFCFLAAFGFLTSSLALAQNGDFGLKGIGLRLGYVDPESEYKGTFLFGGVADLGTVAKNLHADASITYWKSEWDYSYYWFDYADSWTISLSDIAVRGGVKYHFPQEGWAPYAGGGLGMHFYSATWDTPSGEVSWSYSGADGTRFGLYLCGGAQFDLSEKIAGSGELLLDFSEVGQTAFQANVIYKL